ncbi:hypothetical protein ARD30_17350 [Bosea thiooxidans]|uniref:DUF1134 domain-containing protein n=1 Tax=Bosea thiooxidans TaxID=53254 RepID=A0A0Q3SVY0_9HYPH|nr:hypothetical protein [Bosea thiooxidans]KQK29522.1 hypothetical protein ARD30_17350 [Bosea thiooxidans]SKC05305.1 hypothetical protein SAMN05660750_03874 [Bosea thiooxidans]
MMTIRQTAVSFAAFLALASPALGQSSRSLGPSTGSVRIEQVQAGFIASGEAGGGTLRFRGRSYPITVGGLGIGSIGASRTVASGSVYGLRNVSDFAGAYVQLKEGWAVGDQGRGTVWLRNDKGVTLNLATRRQGLQLSLGADGVLIGFKR